MPWTASAPTWTDNLRWEWLVQTANRDHDTPFDLVNDLIAWAMRADAERLDEIATWERIVETRTEEFNRSNGHPMDSASLGDAEYRLRHLRAARPWVAT